jgi:hypothetical protein
LSKFFQTATERDRGTHGVIVLLVTPTSFDQHVELILVFRAGERVFLLGMFEDEVEAIQIEELECREDFAEFLTSEDEDFLDGSIVLDRDQSHIDGRRARGGEDGGPSNHPKGALGTDEELLEVVACDPETMDHQQPIEVWSWWIQVHSPVLSFRNPVFIPLLKIVPS